MTAPTPGGPDRTGPRRRGSALETAILQATIVEIDRHGYADFSMERVAERARAGKASVYRRWPSKVALVMAAVRHELPPPAVDADTGSLREDLLVLFRATVGLLAGPAGTAIRGLVSDALRDPDVAGQLRRYARGRGTAAVQEALHQAGRRGELDPAAISPRQVEAGLSILRFQFLVDGEPPSDRAVVEIIDEVVLPLFRAVGGPPPPPSHVGPRGGDDRPDG